MKGMLNLEVRGGLCDSYVSYPDQVNNMPGVILYMDAIGIRQRIFDMADRIAEQGYFVLAPNLFYRVKKAPIVDYETLLKPENRQELFKQIFTIAPQLTTEMGKDDAEDFLGYICSQPQVNARKIGAVGYCMGGGNALRAAGNFPKTFQSAASFHAGNLATDAESSPHHWFSQIQAEVYIGHADQDQHMPLDQQQRVDEELRKAPGNGCC